MKAKFFYILIAISTLTGCHHDPINIHNDDVSSIELIEVEHHYLNESIDVLPLQGQSKDKLLSDLIDAEPILNRRIFSCHELSIHYKDGSQERFITDGKYIERIKDKKKFCLDVSENLITKYWGITEKEFCIKRGHTD